MSRSRSGTARGSEGVTARFDLLLGLSERGGEIAGAIEYNSDLFDDDRIERMLEHFRVLLEGIVTDPDPANTRAISAYEKAGFEKVKMVDTPDGPVLLMVRNA